MQDKYVKAIEDELKGIIKKDYLYKSVEIQERVKATQRALDIINKYKKKDQKEREKERDKAESKEYYVLVDYDNNGNWHHYYNFFIDGMSCGVEIVHDIKEARQFKTSEEAQNELDYYNRVVNSCKIKAVKAFKRKQKLHKLLPFVLVYYDDALVSIFNDEGKPYVKYKFQIMKITEDRVIE